MPSMCLESMKRGTVPPPGWEQHFLGATSGASLNGKTFRVQPEVAAKKFCSQPGGGTVPRFILSKHMEGIRRCETYMVDAALLDQRTQSLYKLQGMFSNSFCNIGYRNRLISYNVKDLTFIIFQFKFDRVIKGMYV